MAERWIKLYMMDYDETYRDSKMFHLWVDILLHTNPTDYYHHGDLIKKGQCILSLRQVSERCGMAKNTITKYLHLLEECGKIDLDISKKGTLITVKNWDKYQSRNSPSVLKVGQELGQELGQEVGQELGQEVGQELGRNKNKRIKEEKNKRRLTRQTEAFEYLESIDLGDYADEALKKCEEYGLDRIKNLKAFSAKVAGELKMKDLPKKQKEIAEATPEEKEQFVKLMETLEDEK